MMKWTEKQLQTIEERNNNILVSAAAGSGKTAVLVERIKRLILQDKVDVDRFLITTFTKAAAAEMRERLEDTIRKELAEEGADRAFLLRQLRLLPQANISTFHAFTIEVMRRYFYLTDLEPGVKIGDETRMIILKRESIEDVFERRFAEDYEAFSAFLTKYSSSRNEIRLKEGIVKLYDRMRSIPYYMQWTEEQAALLRTDSPVRAFGLDAFLERETEETFRESFRYYEKVVGLLEDAGLEKLALKARENLNLMKSIPARLQSSGEFPVLQYAQLRATKEERDEYKLIEASVKKYREKSTKLMKDLADTYYVFDLAACDEELKGQAADTAYLIGLLKDFEQVYKDKKKDLSVVDFDDVMHYAIDILSDETAAAEYREKFAYIFVDEYQDCNELQETIVEKIARSDNLFMVGDLKQSIYRFRLADPELFRRRYEGNKRGDLETGLNIDLNSNFRSKSSVTSTVNGVFSQIMEGYDENARLNCTVPEEYPGLETELHVIPKDTFEGEPDDFEDAESALIARLIREQLGKTIFDTKKNEHKSISYGDVVVLTRNNGMVAKLERYLNNSGIPAYGQTSGGYLETVEIQVFINMLKVIHNTRQDIPLISVMRSVAFGFDVRELAQIRSFCREGSYYTAVRDYAQRGPDAALCEKITAMFERIEYWKQLRTSVSLEELVRIVMDSTGYFEYCSGLPAGKQRTANLRLLIEKAAEFEENNYSGLGGFLRYVEAMKESDIKVAEASAGGAGDNVVRIMTIHKSKGLEFPIIILAGTGKALQSSRAEDAFSMHRDYAIALPHVNREAGWHRKTLLQKAISAKQKREAIEEEIRVLYVALTRAKDRILITGTVGKEESLDENIVDHATFLQMLYAPLAGMDTKVVIERTWEEAEQGSAVKAAEIRELLTISQQARDEEAIAKVDRRMLARSYEKTGIRSKYSVSQLNAHEETRVSLGQAQFASAARRLSAAEVGTAMHAVMERLDFRRALEEGIPYIEGVADQMTQTGLLSPEERSQIHASDIAGFFEGEPGVRAAKAETLCREREFIMQKELDGEETIVQGIIDCYFEEADGLVLIDYKNSFIGTEQTEEVIRARYQSQLALYREALSAAYDKPVIETYLYLFRLKKFIKMD